MGYAMVSEIEKLKTWILLDQDLKTPTLVNVGGNSQYEINCVGYCIVKAKDRKEAIQFMHWFHSELRNVTIVEPMVVEVKNIDFTPAKIEYE